MANKTIGKLVTKASFSVDSRSRQQLKKFEAKLDRIKKKMGDASSMAGGSPAKQIREAVKQAERTEQAKQKAVQKVRNSSGKKFKPVQSTDKKKGGVGLESGGRTRDLTYQQDLQDLFKAQDKAAKDGAKAHRKAEAEKTKATKTEASKRDQIHVRSRSALFQAGRAGVKGEGIAKLRAELAQLAEAYKKGRISSRNYNDSVTTLVTRHKDAARSAGNLGSTMRNLRRTIVNVTAAYTAFSGVANVAKTGFAIEGTEAIIGGVSKSKEEAESEMQFLRQTSREMGLVLSGIGKDYAQFRAAVEGENVSLQDTHEIFTNMTKGAVAFQLSQDNMKGVFKALQQIVS